MLVGWSISAALVSLVFVLQLSPYLAAGTFGTGAAAGVIGSPILGLPAANGEPGMAGGPHILETWTSVTVPAGAHMHITVGVNLAANSLYSWSAGLRMVGGNFDHHVFWALSAVSAGGSALGQETMPTYRWYDGEADWQNIEFVTGTDAGGTVDLLIGNNGLVDRTFQYVVHNKYIESRTRSSTTIISGSVSMGAFSGLTDVRVVSGLAANTMYVFDVSVELTPFGNDEQQSAILFRCYRANSDPASPGGITHISRHTEFFEFDRLWMNIMVPTRNAGAHCDLWINNWDPNSQTYHYEIDYYTAGSVTRTTFFNGEGPLTCATIAAGGSWDANIVALPAPGRYVAWARIVLSGARSENDFDQKSAWNVAIGYPLPTDIGWREGYKLRYWTNFGSPYDPWGEGTAAYYTVFDTVNLFLHVRNADTVSHNYCYGALVFSW